MGGGVELVECKVCGVSCMLLFGDKMGGLGKDVEKSKKKGDTGAGAAEMVVVVLKVDLHCDKCAGKVRHALKGFSGVNEIKDGGGTLEMTVLGKVNPEQLRANVEEKTKAKVTLVSVSPAATAGDKSTAAPKPATVVLRTLLHCESCVHKCKKIVLKQKGVVDVTIDKERGLNYAITVTGTMDVDRLVRSVQSKLGRKVEAVPAPPKPPEPPLSQQAKKNNTQNENEKKAKDKEKAEAADKKAPAEVKEAFKGMKVEPTRSDGGIVEVVGNVDKNRFADYMEGYLAPQYVVHVYPPQQFSDENPNACSIM